MKNMHVVDRHLNEWMTDNITALKVIRRLFGGKLVLQYISIVMMTVIYCGKQLFL